MKRILIVGAGVAGTIAYKALSANNPSIYEAGPERTCLDSHKAVMRVRDPSTALLLGCSTRSVSVIRQALWKGELVSEASIEMNNLYSMKVSGELTSKSILHLGAVERLLLSGDILPPEAVEFNSRLAKIEKTKDGTFIAVFDQEIEFVDVEYDYMISTIPLPFILDIVGLPSPGGFVTSDIEVTTAEIQYYSSVHQTIYFPEPGYKTYRATIEGKKFMVESIGEVTIGELKKILYAFGLPLDSLRNAITTTQPAGKMSRIDDATRKAALFRLTDEFNILSFGRYAIWKPIRTDEMTKDIRKVISIMDSRSEYELSKERSG